MERYVYAVCTFEEIISRAGTLSGTEAQDLLHMLQTRHRPTCKDVRMYFVLTAPSSTCTCNYQLEVQAAQGRSAFTG